MHPKNPGYKPGDYWVECDRCGKDYRKSQTRKTWDGLIVCNDDWEPRHELDFYRVKEEQISVPDPRVPDVQTVITSVGDADTTLTVGTDTELQKYETTLTANRTVTLDSTGALDGDKFLIYRTNSNSFTVDIGGLYTCPASIDVLVTVTYNGSSWVLDQAIIL